MIPAGYLIKRVVTPPGWLETKPSHIVDVCSVSDCVNDNIVDLEGAWKHNGFGLANSPAVLLQLAAVDHVDSSAATLFYYEAYECELDSDGWSFDPSGWRIRTPLSSSVEADSVELPTHPARLLGFDVVVSNDYLEHSPLSCNSVAANYPVNQHCLIESFDDAKKAIDSGVFGEGCEEGAYSIFAVYVLE